MGTVKDGIIESIWSPENRYKDKWAFNMKVDSTIYGSGLDTEENMNKMYKGLSVGDRVSFDFEVKGEYKNFKTIEKNGSVKESTHAKIPEGMTDEDFLLGNWEMSFRIAKKVIDKTFTKEFLKSLCDLNPHAYIEAVEKTAVSVSIDMKQRGF